MFGCHNCGVNLKNYTNYEDSPCATCEAKNDPYPMGEFEVDASDFALARQSEVYAECEKSAIELAKDHIFGICADALLGLLAFNQKNPRTLRIVMHKMRYPRMSLEELARHFECSKQNIQYHLKIARKNFPALTAALLKDTRFLGSKERIKEERR